MLLHITFICYNLIQMKSVTIFKYLDYKTWLADRLNEEGHGAITRLAKAMECQRSYFSQVLTGHVHLTPDQAFKLGHGLLMNEVERKYLSHMVDYARANDRDYRAHLKSEMEKITSEFNRLEKSVGREKQLVDSSANFYYSAWYCSALHIATSLEGHWSAQDLAKLLNLEYDLVLNCLNELVAFGLVEKKGSHYKYKTGGHHLRLESPLLPHFHSMWRTKAITQFAERKKQPGLNFTVIQSISESDFESFKEELRSIIRKFSKMAEPSDPEVVINFNIDFCKITAGL
jgi:uncharacterized protein (TIGR02147 family)